MKALKKYLGKRKAAIDFLLNMPRSKFTVANYHKLRIEIKKLHALLNLINFCAKDFERKATFKPFQLVFKQTGKVRELQLEEKMIKKYLTVNSIKGYMDSLRIMRLKEQNIFFRMLEKDFFEKLEQEYSKVFFFIDAVDDAKANAYIEKQRNIIKRRFRQAANQTKQLHRFRKRLKSYNYCVRMIASVNQKKSVLDNDLLQALIGNWHDYKMVVKNINYCILHKRIDSKEIKQLKVIKRRIISDRKIIFKRIEALFNSR